MEKTINYSPKGTCAYRFEISYEDDLITAVHIYGGCRGNTKAIEVLLKGMNIEEAIARLEGIPCRGNTSCPDQIAKALKTINS